MNRKYLEEIVAEDAVYEKCMKPQSSGYLDDEYEITNNFRQVEEYHFRIEDDQEILNLQKLQKSSIPLEKGFAVPDNASNEFNRRMSLLLNGLNYSHGMSYENATPIETHGFYTMQDDEYNENQAMQAAYEHIRMENLNNKIANLNINSQNIRFKPKQQQQLKAKKNKQEQQVIKKINKLTIHDQDEL